MTPGRSAQFGAGVVVAVTAVSAGRSGWWCDPVGVLLVAPFVTGRRAGAAPCVWLGTALVLTPAVEVAGPLASGLWLGGLVSALGLTTSSGGLAPTLRTRAPRPHARRRTRQHRGRASR